MDREKLIESTAEEIKRITNLPYDSLIKDGMIKSSLSIFWTTIEVSLKRDHFKETNELIDSIFSKL